MTTYLLAKQVSKLRVGMDNMESRLYSYSMSSGPAPLSFDGLHKMESRPCGYSLSSGPTPLGLDGMNTVESRQCAYSMTSGPALVGLDGLDKKEPRLFGYSMSSGPALLGLDGLDKKEPRLFGYSMSSGPALIGLACLPHPLDLPQPSLADAGPLSPSWSSPPPSMGRAVISIDADDSRYNIHEVKSREISKEPVLVGQTLKAKPLDGNHRVYDKNTSEMSTRGSFEFTTGATLRHRASVWKRYHRAQNPSRLFSEMRDPHAGKGLALVRHYVLSLEFQSCMALLVIANLVFMIAEIVRDGKFVFWGIGWALHTATLTLYVMETAVMLCAFGIRNYFRFRTHWVHVMILPILGMLTLHHIHQKLKLGPSFLHLPHRLHSLPLCVRLIPLLQEFCGSRGFCIQACRNKVSKNKRRYINYVENFDLDLTFITDELIAMGVPATGIEAVYRNPLSEVSRFFKTSFRDEFRIYNACPEMPYSDSLFKAGGGAVVRLQIQDHTPPTMNQFVDFLTDARMWKGNDVQKVIAVHCKAGKGRTGSLCCAWLMYSQHVRDGDEALSYFADCRTDTSLGQHVQGVETPSQVRYVKQLWQHLQRTDSWLMSPNVVPKCEAPVFCLHTLEFIDGLLLYPEKLGRIKILVQSCGGADDLQLVSETSPIEATLCIIKLGAIPIAGDIRIAVFKSGEKDFSAHKIALTARNMNEAPGIVFYIMFHTGFIAMERLQRQEVTRNDSPEADLLSLRVPVEAIDKAWRKPQKHAPGSSLVLKYSKGTMEYS